MMIWAMVVLLFTIASQFVGMIREMFYEVIYRIYFRFFSGRSMVHRVFYSCILRYPGRS